MPSAIMPSTEPSDAWSISPSHPLRCALLLLAAAGIAFPASGQSLPGLTPAVVHPTSSGFQAVLGPETLDVTVCADSVLHIVATPHPSTAPAPQRPWILDPRVSCPGAPHTFNQDAKSASIRTAALQVSIDIARGNLTFLTNGGETLLREGPNLPRTYQPVLQNGESTFRVTDRFSPTASEALYGLGQHQSGLFNYRGATVELGQNNTDVAIPFLVSTTGYALMWNTAALTDVDNRFPLELKFTSIAGHSIDYYFLYGPEMDTLIHEYRSMTGHAPMLPKWAYGFFQSKDRYVSLDEILDIAHHYRDQHIPLDAIVQDWFWWKTEGDPIFNSNYHDVPKDLATLHGEHVHTMISVWGLLDTNSETYKILDAKHLLIPGAHVYDATSPQARDIYWQRLPGTLFAQGWDAFWLDSAEPEEYWPHMGDAILQNKKLAIGNGAEYTNIFPFLHTLGVQNHWQATNTSKRVFILTRSAFLGQQRVGATVWSGDVYSTFWGLSHQVPAGLNFALSGYPYWTTDIGGYWPAYGGVRQEPDFQQLYARWFQFGAFCPIFRTHGHRPHNELWTFDQVEPILLTYDKLRYRLLPYIYSLAWKVSSDDYTIQRPLVMDWRADPNTWNIGDQFMFGPDLLVNPVLQAGATHRAVYLPAAPSWYDFWSGKTSSGSQEIDADAPLDRIPLYVRAGSILPMGPEIEYTAQDPAGPIELRIYRGADGLFNLYEDTGDGDGYRHGQYSLIPVHWNDHDAVLTLGARQGAYPGMISQRTFRVVLVSAGHGIGESVSNAPDAEIHYTGKEMHLTLR